MNINEIIKNKLKVNDFINMFGDSIDLLKELKNTPQDIIWHGEGDVHIHTDMVLDEIYKIIEKEQSLTEDEKIELVYGVLFHDIGKPLVTKERFVERENRTCVVASRHEIVGMSYMAHKLYDVDIPIKNHKNILNLIGYHQVPKQLVLKNSDRYQYEELCKKTPNKLFYLLEIADMRGRIASDKENQLEYIELFKLYSEEYGCYDNFSELFISDNQYIQKKGIRALINQEIYHKDEADKKFYTHKKEYSHLVILVGLSGVGKSHFVDKTYPNYVKISLDDIREEISSRQDLSNERLVLHKAKDLLKKNLANKKNIIYDATNIRKDFRQKVIDLGNSYHALTEIVYLRDRLQNIIKRDLLRKYSVGEKVILKQCKKFEFPELNESDIVNVYEASDFIKNKKRLTLSF